MKLELKEEEQALLRRTLEARLGALRTEMSRTDSPEFSVELRKEEETLERLLAQLRPAAGRPPTRTSLARSAGKRRPRSS